MTSPSRAERRTASKVMEHDWSQFQPCPTYQTCFLGNFHDIRLLTLLICKEGFLDKFHKLPSQSWHSHIVTRSSLGLPGLHAVSPVRLEAT